MAMTPEDVAVGLFDECQRLRDMVGDLRDNGGMPWALLVKREYADARGMFSREVHRGYTNDWREAGRFSRAVAEKYAADCPEKYVAIPLPRL